MENTSAQVVESRLAAQETNPRLDDVRLGEIQPSRPRSWQRYCRSTMPPWRRSSLAPNIATAYWGFTTSISRFDRGHHQPDPGRSG